jgi:RHS repeat-associated protein
MLLRILCYIFLSVLPLLSDENSLFFSDDDPTVFHHVHVISGQLSLSFQDAYLQGAYPLTVNRSYGSYGALERTRYSSDVVLRSLRRGWLIQGGWSFLPHANLMVLPHHDSFSQMELLASEPNGASLIYKCFRKEKIRNHVYHYYYKPEQRKGPHSGVLSARNNPDNNVLRLYVDKRGPKDFDITIFLPNGGERHYTKLSKKKGEPNLERFYYKLVWENLPSKLRLDYCYDNKDRLISIDVKNPTMDKILSWVKFDLIKTDVPYRFKMYTSDNHSLIYQAQESDHRDYLKEVQKDSYKKECFSYGKGSKEQGSRIEEITLDGRVEAKVHYNDSSKHYWSRDAKFYKKYPEVDRVQRLEAPLGPHGEMHTLAEFSYFPGKTEVMDAEGAITHYYYEDDRIMQINKFHRGGELHSSLKFLWKDHRLVAKVLCDAQGNALFSRTFSYDVRGNVQEETLWGQITGHAQGHFEIQQDGSLSHAECVKKFYKEHHPKFNVVLEEEEEGLSYRYTYKADTDLLTSKLTYEGDRIIKREFFLYNSDHLLLEEIVDDGTGYEVHDLSNFSQRNIKRYERNDEGFIRSCSQFVMTSSSFSECLIEKHVYEYDEHHLICKDEVYDSSGSYRYTLHSTYNERGQAVSKTNSKGAKSLYYYDERGNLTRSEEVGLPIKEYEYDALGKVLICREIDKNGQIRVSSNTYDVKGNINSKTDAQGIVTSQNYDSFKHPIETIMPFVKDEKGEVFAPHLYFTYDAANNLTSYTGPRGETTYTRFNVFQKPILIKYPDGTQIQHFYYKNGSLEKTLLQDGSEIHYTYDPFLRKTSEKSYSKEREFLSEEYWKYNTFHLLTHIDPTGLVTTYSYDERGRKSIEKSGDRITSFSYDPLGFLERTTKEDLSWVEVHDEEGKVLKSFEEKGKSIENHTQFFYSIEGLLDRAERITSKGVARDCFFYDAEGRLSRHIDPVGAISYFSYHYIQNDLGQSVLCKVYKDPVGRKTVETYDAAGRLQRKEKQDSQGEIVSKEEMFYDRSGNKAKQLFTVYEKTSPTKTICHQFFYDLMGRLEKQVEADTKTTIYSYDVKGRLVCCTLPSGKNLTYSYDALDRLTSLKSSDELIFYEYIYGKGKHPIEAIDHLLHRSIYRTYNQFDELIEEVSSIGSQRWEYDNLGRCTSFTLPDSSSISYAYESGHLSSVLRYDSNHTPLYNHNYYHFDPNGHVVDEKMIFSLGDTRTDHDLLERPIQQRSDYLTQEISYHLDGRVNSIKNSFFGGKELSYDALGQISQEGDLKYNFDSMGNSTLHEVNDCNQVTKTSESKVFYDEDGHLVKRELKDQIILYSYDALGRLISVIYPDRKVNYSYDPFSRLYSKAEGSKEEHFFFIYDQEKEIGKMDSSLNIIELKVLGLGVQEDIGAAISIEIDHIPYAPLHDLSGNCIALLSSEGALVENYEMTAFGKERSRSGSKSMPINPWRFSSKRHEEDLVFFGKRFYDLYLERWLTPDPTGFADGPNLYAYVLNSPHNRLDLFGLSSQDIINTQIIVHIHQMKAALNNRESLIVAKLVRGEVETDCCIYYGHWHKIQFNANESLAGRINLFDHYVDFLPKSGDSVGILSLENGVLTSFHDLVDMTRSIYNQIPEGTMTIGLHNINKGAFKTADDLSKGRRGESTKAIESSSSFMELHMEALHKINPEVTWAAFFHSEGGLIGRRAIERLSEEGREKVKQHAVILALGPAMPIPREYAGTVINTYSEKDFVTKWFAYPKDGFSYDVHFVPCLSSRKEKVAYLADHKFMGSTYQKENRVFIRDLRKEKGFYGR